jgi:hypothetical protein
MTPFGDNNAQITHFFEEKISKNFRKFEVGLPSFGFETLRNEIFRMSSFQIDKSSEWKC